jgi:xylulokinase
VTSTVVPGASVFVGLDLGTSSLKAVAVDEAGSVVVRATVAYPTFRGPGGAAEQEPADWFAAVRAVVAELVAVVPGERWAGVGLSAMIPTLVLADADGQAIGRARTWEDDRAQECGVRLRQHVGAASLYHRTGQWVDGRYLLPMAMQRLAEATGDRAAEGGGGVGAARWILGAKDLLLGWLTGELVTDPSTAAGYGCFDLRTMWWADDIVAATAGLAGTALPALPGVLPSMTAFPLLPGRADELGLPAGLPIVLGAADSVLGAYGLGLAAPGEVAYLAGTSTVILSLSSELVLDPEHRYLVTPLASGDGWGLEMDLLSTGSAIRWLATLVSEPEDRLLALAGAVDPGMSTLPTFLPYLAPGEQGALWDAELAGSVVGLDLSHGSAELGRALLNGILVESRRCLAALDAVAGSGPVRLAGYSTGGGFGQELSDATGRPVVVTDDRGRDASALGAALLARTAISGAVAATAAQAPGVTMLVPDQARARVWTSIAERHDGVLHAFRPVMAERDPLPVEEAMA